MNGNHKKYPELIIRPKLLYAITVALIVSNLTTLYVATLLAGDARIASESAFRLSKTEAEGWKTTCQRSYYFCTNRCLTTNFSDEARAKCSGSCRDTYGSCLAGPSI